MAITEPEITEKQDWAAVDCLGREVYPRQSTVRDRARELRGEERPV